MNILLAHIKKDAITVRKLLYVWAAFVGIDLVFGIATHALHISPKELSPQGAAWFMATIFSLLIGIISTLLFQAVVLMLLIVRIIQTDSLIDPDAYWRTRPIARLNLLKEKTLFTGSLAIASALAVFALGVQSNNLDPKFYLPLFLGLVAFAAITKNLSNLILTFLGFTIGAHILSGVALSILRYLVSITGTTQSIFPIHSANAASAGAFAVYTLGFLVIIAHQYLTLQTRRSQILLGLTLFLAAFASNF
jgi:hypothetical protein